MQGVLDRGRVLVCLDLQAMKKSWLICFTWKHEKDYILDL